MKIFLLLRYLPLIRHVVLPLFLCVLLSVTKVVYILFNLMLMPSIFDRLFVAFDVVVLIKILFLTGLLLALNIFADVMLETVVAHIQYKLSMKIKLSLLRRSFRYPQQFFGQTNAGELSKLIIRDTDMVAQGLREMAMIGSTLLQVGLMAWGAIHIAPWYGKLYLLMTAILLTWNILWRPFYNWALEKMGNENTRAYGFLWSSLLSFRDIKILGLESKRIRDFDGIQNKQKRYLFRHDFLQFWMGLLNQPLSSLGFAVVLFLLLNSIKEGQASVGMLAAYSSLIYMLLNPVLQLVQSIGFLENGTVGAKLLRSFQSYPREKNARKSWPGIQEAIVCKNVNFAYDPQRPILQDLTMVIPKGWHVGVVGSTGCGKSTLLSLLLKINQNFEGEILVDTTDLRKLKNESVRDGISYLGQDSLCFLGNVLQNIDPKSVKSLDQIQELCRQVQFAPVLDRLQGGLFAQIDDGSLSGGERQRLFLARALAKEAELLLFDEATSALDPHTENLVLETLKQLRLGRSSVTIAHRLTALRDTDWIYVMDRGRIVEEGALNDLIARKGHFWQLFQSQIQTH